MNKLTQRTFLSIALLFSLAGGVRGQVLTPITVSMSTQTGEVENALGIPANGDPDDLLPVGDSGEYFYLQGDNPDDANAGLPDDGTIVSTSNTADTTVTFQLAPYTGPNILVSDGTLTLATPASYSNLAFLVDSLTPPRIGDPATFILNFTDRTSDTLSTGENAPNWLGGVPGDANGSVAYSNTMLYSQQLLNFDETVINLDQYDFTLSAEDTAKTLASIDINANGGELVTYAVSGTDPPAPDAPEPRPVDLMALAFGAVLFGRWMQPRFRR